MRALGDVTTPSSSEPIPVPVRVLPSGGQEVVAHLWSRRQARDSWRYEVGLPAYRNGPGDTVEPAEYRVWGRAPEHVRPVNGVSYDAVPTEYLEQPSPVQKALGTRRPSGWVLAKVGGRGPGRAVSCTPSTARRRRPGRRCCLWSGR